MVDMDKFSNLPKDITESILTLMPLKDAVRTSILSKGWRHKWTSIPSLVFTKDCCPASCKEEPAIFTPEYASMLKERRHKLTSIINHVLSLHTGPVIQVFKVAEYCPRLQLDSWLLRVCQSNVKELSVLTKDDSDDHDWSSSLYSCTTLTHLNLSYCPLKPPPPPFFNGLKNLKTLDLTSVYLAKDVLERILRGCPVLENLSLFVENIVPNLRINAPRLRCLDVVGEFHKITFGDTHAELSVVRIWFGDLPNDNGTESYMAEFFSKIPNVETIEIEGRLLPYLSGGLIPKRLPTPCYNLHTLTLMADFHNEVFILGALCILKSTPNLSTLKISDRCGKNRQLENIKWECFSCTLNKLTTLVVNPYKVYWKDEDEELHFIIFLLKNSTALQKMTIHYIYQDDLASIKPNYQPYTQWRIQDLCKGGSENVYEL